MNNLSYEGSVVWLVDRWSTLDCSLLQHLRMHACPAMHSHDIRKGLIVVLKLSSEMHKPVSLTSWYC